MELSTVFSNWSFLGDLAIAIAACTFIPVIFYGTFSHYEFHRLTDYNDNEEELKNSKEYRKGKIHFEISQALLRINAALWALGILSKIIIQGGSIR